MLWLLGIPVLYLLILLLVAWISVRPYRIPQYLSPASLGAPQEEVQLRTSDGVQLGGWWIRAENARTVAVLAHGYMLNRCELSPEAFLLWRNGVSCMLLDLRCHGRSGGRSSTMGLRERLDIAAGVEFARSRTPGARVVLLGSSMGAAASALALADDPTLADAIILDSVYGRLSGAILGWWRFLGGKWLSVVLAPTALIAWPFVGVNPFVVDVADAIARWHGVPVLFFHGNRDSLAVPSEAERNFARASEPKRIVWFDGCGHSEGRWQHAEVYHRELLDFLQEHGLVESCGRAPAA